MSDVPHGADSPQGPGWWQASDDRWYPGELHPWREQAGSAVAPTQAFRANETYLTATSKGPFGRNRAGRMALVGFVVLVLALTGAVIVGKTVTTEFASQVAGKTHNPWDLARTPGGSSSGSAAAVACGMLRAGLGTEVIGSILRPASYCGCIGYKPGQRCCESDGFGVGFVTGTDGEIAEARGLPTY